MDTSTGRRDPHVVHREHRARTIGPERVQDRLDRLPTFRDGALQVALRRFLFFALFGGLFRTTTNNPLRE